MCRFGRAIDRCDFYDPYNTRIKLNPEFPETNGFKYYGNGLDNGQCGITIQRLDMRHQGNWTCRLDFGDGRADAVGRIQVEIAQAPQQPRLEVTDVNNLHENQELDAQCSFRDGHPPANISWFLGQEQIYPRNPDSHFDEEGGSTIVTSHISRILTDRDHLKLLTCRLNHPAFSSGFTNSSVQLNVNFQPKALSRDELFITGLEIGRTADIEIKIRANPRPRLQWTIDGQVLHDQQTQRYVVSQAEQTEDGRWSAKLTIIELTLQDTTKTYTLRADNAAGATDYQIRIGGSRDAESNKH